MRKLKSQVAKIERILEFTNSSKMYDLMIERIKENFASFNAKGSNWVFESIIARTIHIDDYRPMGGSSYIKLPKILKDKKAIINPKNKNVKCFMWAILAVLYPAERHIKRISNYKEHVNKLSWGRR